MSQIFKTTTGGGGGSSINEIDTQNGNATPIANVIILDGFDSTINNVNGISTRGGVVGTGVQNEVDVLLTNRFHGSGTTTDATPTTIATCPMSTNPAVFRFTIELCAYDVTDNAGLTTISSLSFRTTGGVPVLLTPEDNVTQEDPGALFPAGTSINFNGSSTTFSVIVTGVAATTIKWLCHGTYTVVS